MTVAEILLNQRIVSVSDLQKNPLKALEGKFVRIVKNGKEIGIYISKDEFEDLMEENLRTKSSFKEELKAAVKNSKTKTKSLDDIL